ncbi:hypothetical protein KIPB_006760 [Kipferlia bialata]|uniref:F5/8 type C domain-containing protein n=1 Tax=Kipferlia bialata TaxID=797122 RepID=A0A9K3CZP2_9EUKA|nr:hypothetical protein KIPB_006760 [Kipferlia bialata]|eukprot:g6760.t1
MAPLASNTTSTEGQHSADGEIVKAGDTARTPSLLETLYAMLHRQNCVIDDLNKQTQALRETVEGLKRERDESTVPASLSPSEGVSELAHAKATLLQGYTLNPKPLPFSSPLSDAASAYASIQRLYPNHPLMEVVQQRAARIDFSGKAIHDTRDHHSDCTLTYTPGLFSDVGAWVANRAKAGQFAQVTFERPVVVVGVATAGRPTNDERVTSFKVEVFDTDTRTWVAAEPGVEKYTGNKDRNTIVLQTFGNPVVAKQLRITALSFNSRVAMRFEVYAWAY